MTGFCGLFRVCFGPLGFFSDLISILAACNIFILILLSSQNVDLRLKPDPKAFVDLMLHNMHEI